MEKVAVYLSFKKNSDDIYIMNQKNIINEYCINNNYDYDLFLDNVDSNRDSVHRKELNKLIECIENNKYKKVVIKGINNFSRNINDVIDFLYLLNKNNCSIECIDQNKIDLKFLNELCKLNMESEELER